MSLENGFDFKTASPYVLKLLSVTGGLDLLHALNGVDVAKRLFLLF